MKHYLLKHIIRSLRFYPKDAVNQIIIIALLAAIITGSLFTGYSVRKSLGKTTAEKLGETDILISSGLRFFDSSLSDRLSEVTGAKVEYILEADGYCQNFSTGVAALNSKIYGVTDGFFRFHGSDSVKIEPGTVAINSKLAHHLGVNTGDEIIIRFREADPIPANAPFAPKKVNEVSKVMKVGIILQPFQTANFSLGISQVIPMNIFMNISELSTEKNGSIKTNRLLVKNSRNYPDTFFYSHLTDILRPSDIGLSVRKSVKTGEPELVSDRIFIDSAIVASVLKKIPGGYPVITYLANTLQVGKKSSPYSFIAAFSGPVTKNLNDYEIIINHWLANDLEAKPGDLLTITWYDPGSGNLLVEKSWSFKVKSIIDNNNRYSDPGLMPDFPGISGSTTCSAWDAGIPILLNKIRDKDEEYWNIYRGTPKAFISYETGKRLWGNNFGPATAIRLPQTMDIPDIVFGLTGSLDPGETGVTVSSVRELGNKAANEGIDFSTLFLSLGFFIIISSVILLSLAVSMFFNSKKDQLKTYYALGYRNRLIRKLLFLETSLISLAGIIPGIFLGYLVNVLIINSLNSVWSGAVQTNTLSAEFGLVPLILGILVTMIVTLFLLRLKLNRFLINLRKPVTGELSVYSARRNLVFLIIGAFVSVAIIFLSFFFSEMSTLLSFAGGSFLFIALVFAVTQYYADNGSGSGSLDNRSGKSFLSRRFYSFHPSQAVTPVIFIAAGIFAVIITGANRQTISDKMLLPEGGTGGYLFWAESAVQIKENLNSLEGKKEFGLDENGLEELKFVQARRLSGDDASCLNLNHVTAPAVLGIDPSEFIKRGSFSFAASMNIGEMTNPWSLLEVPEKDNTIYGIADQTVLQWGLKVSTGDTLVFRSERGQLLKIVLCAGLRSSVFQGYLLIGEENFSKFFPSVPGSSVFLIDGKRELSELYRNAISDRLSGYGLSIEPASEKLSSFFTVTNTYLDVFTILGAFGLVLGIAGLGFVLIRNYNERKHEFAIMMATGYTIGKIRSFILKDQIIILISGVVIGTVSALTATLPSLRMGKEMPWVLILLMILAVFLTGLITLLLSVKNVRSNSLVIQLRKE